MMQMKKRLILSISEEIIQTLEENKTEKWLLQNLPKYDPSLRPKPQKYQTKKLYRPRVSPKTYYDLQEIPGNSNTQKIVNLYYNIKRQEEKKENRKKVLKELFPNHPYNFEE